jgi:ABC-type branched-subunit amino acid transport system permease subunit
VGGLRTFAGPILGAVFTELSFEWLRAWGEVRMVVFALLVILVARGYPAGLAGVFRTLGLRLAARLPRLAPLLTPRHLGD